MLLRVADALRTAAEAVRGRPAERVFSDPQAPLLTVASSLVPEEVLGLAIPVGVANFALRP
jgi:hypothetical protein